MKWVNALEELPKKDGEYLCVLHGCCFPEMKEFYLKDEGGPEEYDGFYDDLGHMNAGGCDTSKWTQAQWDWKEAYCRVTHWMPKPEMPEEKDRPTTKQIIDAQERRRCGGPMRFSKKD